MGNDVIMPNIFGRLLGTVATLCLLVTPALAATDVPHLDGKLLGILWVLPFVGMLLSLSLIHI